MRSRTWGKGCELMNDDEKLVFDGKEVTVGELRAAGLTRVQIRIARRLSKKPIKEGGFLHSKGALTLSDAVAMSEMDISAFCMQTSPISHKLCKGYLVGSHIECKCFCHEEGKNEAMEETKAR